MSMEQLHEPKPDALRALYWRDEILQLMFWIHGEGFGDEVGVGGVGGGAPHRAAQLPTLLERFLGVDAQVGPATSTGSSTRHC